MKPPKPPTPQKIPTIKPQPTSPIPPPTPPINPKTPTHLNPIKPSIPPSKTQKNLTPKFSHIHPLQPLQPWQTLNISPSELSLPLTFPTGQTFTWKQTSPFQFTGPINSHLISLKHDINGCDQSSPFSYLIHHSPNPLQAKASLYDFLNLTISLNDLFKSFSESDSRFAQLAPHLAGARVLRQDPIECLFQFLCSSNNNIGRITKMVGFLSSLGEFLGTVGDFDFYEFPSLERLSMVSEAQLREAGFGYRAKYIVGAVKALQSKPGGGAEWLSSLRGLELHEVVDALCTLPGVGPKVAACIALFSLDQHHAIPVDTHVWQIATRYITPELAGARLTPALCSRVAEAFVGKYGKYAGWAQTVLFIGELPSQKALLPSHLCSIKETKTKSTRKRKLGKLEVSIQFLSDSS
ncbi:8-oxoguanine-DNA glycosylase 1 [Tasmannia lanceolata]|uniref:8-oxoguanine-DNA glycosylase 1 n=1 Tax=Tasmannia lanceolata TaxID=3420 RepID=UPI0040646508